MESSSVQTLQLPVASTKQFQKYPISSIHNLGFYIDKLNEGNGIRRPFYLGVSGSALSFSARGRRRAISNGKSHNYSLRCSSQLASELAPAASAAYGVLLLGGGLFAYTRTGSKGSLLGGLTGAGLMGTAYFLMQASGTKEIGEALAFGSALLFASVFGIRLAATRKIMPAGPLLTLSIFALALFISAYLQETV